MLAPSAMRSLVELPLHAAAAYAPITTSAVDAVLQTASELATMVHDAIAAALRAIFDFGAGIFSPPDVLASASASVSASASACARVVGGDHKTEQPTDAVTTSAFAFGFGFAADLETETESSEDDEEEEDLDNDDAFLASAADVDAKSAQLEELCDDYLVRAKAYLASLDGLCELPPFVDVEPQAASASASDSTPMGSMASTASSVASAMGPTATAATATATAASATAAKFESSCDHLGIQFDFDLDFDLNFDSDASAGANADADADADTDSATAQEALLAQILFGHANL